MVPRFAVSVLVGLAAVTALAQQALVCPPGSSTVAHACDIYHFHLQAYRPETRQFAELSGVNQFASQSACDRYRDAQIKRNLAVVDYFKRVKGEQQYEPDRFGPCHCDMTTDKTNAMYLNDQQRLIQLRTTEDIRLHVRERLLDSDLTSDSDLVRGLIPPPTALPILGGPKVVPLPPAPQSSISYSADDLKATKAIDTAKPTTASLDLPLVDIPAPSAPPLPEVAGSVAPPTPAAPPSTTTTPAAEAAGTPPAEAVPAADPSSAADAAENFVSYETQRIQNVLKASASISDEAMKSKIFEACMQRIQLLSNLRSLIEGSGSKSRLASAARAAQTESDRIALVTKLFGDTIATEWAPKDATDVVLQPNADTDSEPERVLRDSSGRFNEQQKKRALYVLLARSQPTDQQQLWLVTVVDSFLQ
ncbi:MAG TPA: hypothetical protein VLV78_22935 [Thermoanaerobaculia bacterium]|nr:hypothetical protein [Thermoanaerobaculia bacterium]